MSWNKNTIVTSNLDGIKAVLDTVQTPYELEYWGRVMGRGLNDGAMFGDDVYYHIRCLQYADRVILEQMQCSVDCDFDDYLVSVTYEKRDAPKRKDYQIQIYVDEEVE